MSEQELIKKIEELEEKLKRQQEKIKDINIRLQLMGSRISNIEQN